MQSVEGSAKRKTNPKTTLGKEKKKTIRRFFLQITKRKISIHSINLMIYISFTKYMILVYYFSSSSESDDRFVTSTVSFNDDSDHENGRIHAIDYSLPRKPLAPLAPYSPVSSTTGALTIYRRLTKATPQYVNPFYRQDLMEIAMKTIILLQKNRSLHARLLQLKLETRDFVNSVMSNPENAKLRETLNQSNEKTINHSPSKILAIKNQ